MGEGLDYVYVHRDCSGVRGVCGVRGVRTLHTVVVVRLKVGTLWHGYRRVKA